MNFRSFPVICTMIFFIYTRLFIFYNVVVVLLCYNGCIDVCFDTSNKYCLLIYFLTVSEE